MRNFLPAEATVLPSLYQPCCAVVSKAVRLALTGGSPEACCPRCEGVNRRACIGVPARRYQLMASMRAIMLPATKQRISPTRVRCYQYGRQCRPGSVARLHTAALANLQAERQQRRHISVGRELAVLQKIRHRICRAGAKWMSAVTSSPDESRAQPLATVLTL